MVASLPQEILDAIIDTIYSSDGTQTLKALSMVSKEWCSRSQRHIFREFSLDRCKMQQIHFDTSEVTDAPTNTSRQQFPVALSYVQELNINAQGFTPLGADGA